MAREAEVLATPQNVIAKFNVYTFESRIRTVGQARNHKIKAFSTDRKIESHKI